MHGRLVFFGLGGRTNFWGLGCPFYCGALPLSGFLATFLLGWICGLLTLVLALQEDPPAKCLHKQAAVISEQSLSLQSFGGPKVGHGGTCLLEGAPHDFVEEGGVDRPCRWSRAFDPSWKSKSKGRPKEEGKRKRQGRRRGGRSCGAKEVGLHPAVLDHIDSTLSFTRWALCLPRWILATRADFARSLSLSFSVEWHGTPMRTAASYPGCFSGGGPGLSLRRLRVLAQKRLVHTIVIALNHLYLGRFATKG